MAPILFKTDFKKIIPPPSQKPIAFFESFYNCHSIINIIQINLISVDITQLGCCGNINSLYAIFTK